MKWRKLGKMKYSDFLKTKSHVSINHGISPRYMPDCLFDFQKYACEYAINKGRCAVFFDTGLGKTLMELVIARNYFEQTNKPVLIITPLAVAFQFVKECERFEIGSIEYSKDGSYSSDIVVCNYERLSKFNHSDFDCVILDESSILKNFNGAIKTHVTTFLRKVKYRYLFTATPSPNDFIELGTSSEALGYMGYMEMLSAFFGNNENNIRPQEIATKWYLKPHAEESFFKWVSGWSISMRRPSDLGFDDSKFILPKLTVNYHPIKNHKNWVVDGQVMMFNKIAHSMSDVRIEQKMTIDQRCEKAVEIAEGHDTSVYWTTFNKESELIARLDTDAHEIKGSMSLDAKEEVLLAFASGEIKKLVTKPKMTAFGLNWQHCNHTVYFPTWSYEQYYQSIRRFWRFGQTSEVTVDLVHSDGQKRVIDTLLLKTEKADQLFYKLNSKLNEADDVKAEVFDNETIIPSFINQ